MAFIEFKVVNKIKLTDNVYEIIYSVDEMINIQYGQFVTFIIEKIGGRSYSILKTEGNNIHLIIKKREGSEGGRGGSQFLCDQRIGDTLRGVGAAGHFVLKNNNKNKLFLGTGTGFVPLYNQIIGALQEQQNCRLKLIFGVKTKKDLFYIQELEKLQKKNANFNFEIYISRERIEGYSHGYITDFLTRDNIENFEEFYICGAPGMIDSAVCILRDKKVSEECVFTEKY